MFHNISEAEYWRWVGLLRLHSAGEAFSTASSKCRFSPCKDHTLSSQGLPNPSFYRGGNRPLKRGFSQSILKREAVELFMSGSKNPLPFNCVFQAQGGGLAWPPQKFQRAQCSSSGCPGHTYRALPFHLFLVVL